MTMNSKQAWLMVGINAGFGMGLVLGFGMVPVAAADGESVTIHQPVHQTGEVDYMSDGSRFLSDDTGENDAHQVLDTRTHQWRDVTESDTEWSCVDDGNQVCGPHNTEGKPAGCYDGGGVLVRLWPCEAVKN